MNVVKLLRIVATLFIVFGTTEAVSQISVSPWKIHEGKEGVLAHEGKFAGDPSAYPWAKIPASNDSGWLPAPLDAKGNVSMRRTSVLKCRKEIDFTYFQTIVNVPANTTVTDFKVSYDNADDGARIYLFNSKFPNGTFDEKSDLVGKNSSFTSTNLNDKVSSGENRIVIVQFDDCATGNNISGIHIQVNGKEVKPTTAVAAAKKPTTTATSGTNIAKGKSCKASSVNFGGVASRAVDGNTDGAYGNNSCTHSNDEKDPWWEIDLGAYYDVSKIVIWNRTDDCCWNRLQGFYVMASEQQITGCSTGSEFQFKNGGALSFSSGSQSSMTLEGNKKCRYIRIFIPGAIKILSLAEVEVFGQLSKSQTVSASQSSGDGIAVFEHTNYGGKTKSFGVGNHDITETEFNDIISSIKIQKGYKVTLYQDWKLTGPTVVLTADTPDLRKLNFNDLISSIKVEKL